MMDYLFMVTVAFACFSLPEFCGTYRGRTLGPSLWVAWGWILGQLALTGAVYISGMGQ